MRIYVAGKYEEWAAVREVQKRLMNEGHTITHDWTGLEGGAGNVVEWAQNARDDLRGVRTADALVMLPHNNGFGLMVELGAALILGIPVLLIGTPARNTVFWHMGGVEVLSDLDAVCLHLRNMTRQ